MYALGSTVLGGVKWGIAAATTQFTIENFCRSVSPLSGSLLPKVAAILPCLSGIKEAFPSKLRIFVNVSSVLYSTYEIQNLIDSWMADEELRADISQDYSLVCSKVHSCFLLLTRCSR